MKIKIVVSIVMTSALFAVNPVLAHAVVSPNQIGVAAFQTYTLGVPSEKDMPTVSVRLVMPGGVKEVTPNVMAGWKIDEKKDGDNVTEITWTGGSIPAGQRDEFKLSAQAPDQATTLAWKAYQTYSDGSVVSWDETPGSKPPAGQDELTPYSETKVVKDVGTGSSTDRLPLYLSIAAVVIAAAALVRKQ